MNRILLVIFGVCLCATRVESDEPVCAHCAEVREYNKEHHKNYEYFDDYLKDPQAASSVNCIAPIDNSKSADSKETENNSKPANK